MTQEFKMPEPAIEVGGPRGVQQFFTYAQAQEMLTKAVAAERLRAIGLVEQMRPPSEWSIYDGTRANTLAEVVDVLTKGWYQVEAR